MKRARGTYQPCRNSPSEPRGTAGIPDAPPGLDARERAEWETLGQRLAAMGDRAALAAIALVILGFLFCPGR